ncbi:MAG: YjjG family noncanonical pyrimidine nucleotidase [Bacteroidia bacterium]|jgi:putative hydrolase of the HAD superfamily|nr:YjjG family noncanonical pyrimidine nucleotidase [Bacteroidia bacterium]MBP6009587.1 YjjG family noncanonical pyrimidine nucleotidase [Bacteroidia bacterium]MBP7270473.1 YjjG family noncanonical pyrimidine nucleotidase [Bacteroidia bacterium]MBP7438224.1 YjjG family noncanonical pyrimidine nucleotidase [Bacteroidia bacterium]MBP7771672.1 YjjG family noncanonical pyrimidine nucleotidase [Bacteroidia bacterium]
MSKYRHIFFDLDNTLWDFERNSLETLTELFDKYRLTELGVPSFEAFVTAYHHRNEILWDEYRKGLIDKATLRDQRFAFTFWDMGLEPGLAPPMLAHDYVTIGPRKNRLFPHAHETLRYLKEKYTLHIITNGFEEAQHIKIEAAELKPYFEAIIISEHTGFRKPDAGIFRYAEQQAGCKPEECLMIGDGLEVDVIGAQDAGWDAVYFNPGQKPHTAKPTYEIGSLDELRLML